MNMMPERMHQENVTDVWPLIEDIARTELHFTQEALAYYRTRIADEELARLIASEDIPVSVMCRDRKVVAVFIGAKPEGGIGTILWLVVSRAYRGQGFGSALFRWGCDAYRVTGCHKIKLTAPTQEAVGFYKQRGMTVEGFHPHHWWGMDFWSMGMFLDKR